MDPVAQVARSVEMLVPTMAPFSATNVFQIMLGDEFKNDRAREALTTLLGSRPRHITPEGHWFKTGAGKLFGKTFADESMSGLGVGQPPVKWDSTKKRFVPDRKIYKKKLPWWRQAETGHVYETRKDRQLAKEPPPKQPTVTAPPPGAERM